ncbi:MAG: SprT family zinc-dependent metalloprotease [Candidatus Eisenbacteria bacterium]
MRRTARRTLEIAVQPSGALVVTAPAGASLERVRAAVRSRVKWIRAQLVRFESLAPPAPPRRHVAGETHRYLGRQYRLRIRRGRVDRVRLDGSWLSVTTTAPANRQHVRLLVERWYEQRAAAVLGARLAHCLAEWRAAQLSAPTLAIRHMVRRWGSCSRAGRVTLNVELVKVPTACIDYVIVHELCHLRALNHGREFRALLARRMPDWQRRRERLERQEV